MDSKPKKETTVDVSCIVKFIASNWYSYAMFALALLVCFYTLYNVEDYQQKINNKWMLFINDHCSCSAYYKPDTEFGLQTPGDMIKNYGKSNYNTSIYFVGGQPASEGEYLYGGIDNGIENLNNNS